MSWLASKEAAHWCNLASLDQEALLELLTADVLAAELRGQLKRKIHDLVAMIRVEPVHRADGAK
jgi:hypothetical protein